MTQGPNVKRLIIHKMATDAVPKGGGLVDAIRFLSGKESILAGVRAATEWVNLVIAAVREAAEPNPWRTADDEAIAGEILRAIDEKKGKR